MAKTTTAVHVTHEAADKIGGIGAVLQGLFTCNSYLKNFERSIVIGPLFSSEGSALGRLGANGEILYSSVDSVANVELIEPGYLAAFRSIEKFYNVSLVYGRKGFVDEESGITSCPEILLIDVRRMNREPINEFKKKLFEEFDIRSDSYEDLWEYEQYVRLAPVAISALKALGAADSSTTIIAHEFMGMPTALAGVLERYCGFKTVFYAHEVAPMRRITEKHAGHDVMFYNVLKDARKNKVYLKEAFGDQSDYFKHPLVEASRHCDGICAVGDYVAEELRFLSPEFENAAINVVYNGIPAYEISAGEKQRSREKLRLYCDNVLGYRPDFIFTHVTRLVSSKGLWRDLQVLEHIEKDFRAEGKTAVMLLLSTQTAQRPSEQICRMESEYNWPAAHREGWPDLSDGEAELYAKIQEFNARSRNIKIIFINQFGFEQQYCGRRMPEDMQFMDIRKGSDVEFGLSVYEPFGISQLEPLTFGAICVVSSVCGCAGFVREAANGDNVQNIIIADYTDLNHNGCADIKNPLDIDRRVRVKIEKKVSEKLAVEIIRRLGVREKGIEEMIQSGCALAKRMNWDTIVRKYLLRGLRSKSQAECVRPKA